MSLRSRLLIALSTTVMGTTAASAGLVGVTSYEMNNGNGVKQFTFGNNYFDFTYTNNATNTVDPNANKNGSSQYIPNNSAPQEALLSGGKGLLADGKIPTQNYTEVTGASSGQYVGWKYQDPTILFKLSGGQSVSSISLYVAATTNDVHYGLVAAPSSVLLKLSDGSPITYTQQTSAYLGSPFTSVITLTLDHAVSSDLAFSLTLNRGPLQADGRYYYENYVQGYNGPFGPNTCLPCDPDLLPDLSNAQFASGFRTEAALGLTGPLPDKPFGLEPWIMLSEVEFNAAVPEPSTWVMMIAGFAGLGFMAYRRKARQPALATA
jgi:hypothetical protein